MKKLRFNKFNKSIIKKRLLPRTYRTHILLSFLFLSFIPLILIGLYSFHSVQKVVHNTSADIEEEIINAIIQLHQTHLNTQASLIHHKIEEAKKTVLMGRTLAEDLFQHPDKYPVTTKVILKKEKEGYHWSETYYDQSNVIISARTEVSPEIFENISKTAYLNSLFRETVDSTPHMAAMYIIFSDSSSRIYPPLNVPEEVQGGFLKPDIDFTKQSFYEIAVDENRGSPTVSISEVYQDITHRDQVFTLSSPIIVNGEKIGIIGVDITIPRVLNHILNFKFREEDAYAILMNEKYSLIAYQDEAEPDLEFYTLENRQKLYESERPFATMVNQEEKYVLLSPIMDTSWKLMYVIPKQEILSSVTEITNQHIDRNRQLFYGQFLSAVIVIIFIVMVLTLRMWTYVTRPLQHLLTGIHALTAGKLNTTIAIDNLVEFKAVGRAFNQMANALNDLMNDYIKLNNELEEKVKKRTKQLELANQSLSETNALLQSIDSSRRELFSNISHDLKTPITICMGYIEAIRDGMIAEDKLEMYLHRIQRQLSSLQQLTKGLYELSTIESKRNLYNFQDINPHEFFYSILHTYVDRGQKLSISISDNLPPLMKADSEYLKRAIYNLIDNAMKYSPTGEPIEISVYEENDAVIFMIKDSGIGIPEEDLPHIFDRFYRVDKSRNSSIPGNGLGLAIVKEIIEEHHGSVTVESDAGKGSIFTVRLPFGQKEER